MLGFIYNHSSEYFGICYEHVENFIKFLFLQYSGSTSYFAIAVLKTSMLVVNAKTFYIFSMVLEVH